MVGNLVAKVATGCRAEPGDLYAATRMAWSDGRLAPGSAPDPRAAPSAGQAVRAGDRRGYRSPGLDQVPAAPLHREPQCPAHPAAGRPCPRGKPPSGRAEQVRQMSLIVTS